MCSQYSTSSLLLLNKDPMIFSLFSDKMPELPGKKEKTMTKRNENFDMFYFLICTV